MKYDIIHLNGFMYAVEEPTKIIKDDYFFYRNYPELQKSGYEKEDNDGLRKVVATNDPSLKLPLLPAVEEDVNAEQFIKKQFGFDNEMLRKWEQSLSGNKYADYGNILSLVENVYKAASAKEFTKEDMRKAFQAGRDYELVETSEGYGTIWQGDKESRPKDFDFWIQSLRLKPVAVELEVKDIDGYNYQAMFPEDFIPIVDENNYVTVKQWYYE